MENCESESERESISSLCEFIDSYYQNLSHERQQIFFEDKQTQTENENSTFFKRFVFDFFKSIFILILYKLLIHFFEN